MRGAHQRRVQDLRRRGIIPAYAGSTACCVGRTSAHWDHPRVCGEHNLLGQLTRMIEGSSPRMRGAPKLGAITAAHPGIIPAYAGSTCAARARSWSARDHPRVCGEHSATVFLISPCWGSSPRMRGAPRLRIPWPAACGIIPAYAGSTTRIDTTFETGEDHPRVCGEHYMDESHSISPAGIIPAYAGSTLHEVHRFDSKVQFVYGCQGSVHCSVLQLFIPTGTGRGRQVRNADVLPLARSYLPYFLAALNLLALLQPVGGIPSSLASSVPLGLLISSTPSQSTGSQSG